MVSFGSNSTTYLPGFINWYDRSSTTNKAVIYTKHYVSMTSLEADDRRTGVVVVWKLDGEVWSACKVELESRAREGLVDELEGLTVRGTHVHATETEGRL